MVGVVRAFALNFFSVDSDIGRAIGAIATALFSGAMHGSEAGVFKKPLKGLHS